MAYDKAAVALGFTLEELEAMATAANPGIIGVSCIKCDLPVALWGFGLYIFDTDDNTLIVIDYICKACWKYSLSNPRFDREEDTEIAPPLFFSALALLARWPVKTSQPAANFIQRCQQAWDELWERHDQAVAAGESFNANKHDLSGIKRRLDEAVDLRQQLRNTRVANFRMPPRSPKRTQLESHAKLRQGMLDYYYELFLEP
ncbi:hypothetical protein K438DRAFT_1793648, partial [Mycena galopus ATCC 62051]